MMKSGYNNTIHEEGGELKPLTNANAGIPETGGSPITKKHLVGMLIMGLITGFMMGHLTNTQHSGLGMSQESMTAQHLSHTMAVGRRNLYLVPRPLELGIWRCCSGQDSMDVSGTKTLSCAKNSSLPCYSSMSEKPNMGLS